MKKYILSFAVLGFCFVWACKPKEVIPQVTSSVILDDNSLLKSVAVKGASEVKIDHEKGIIQVTLPESFASKSVELDFVLYKNIVLEFYDNSHNVINKTNSTSKITENGILEFSFQGATPLRVNVILPGIKGKSYDIYVNQLNKKLQTEISKIDSVHYSLALNFYLKLTSFNGTYPATPNEKLPIILLRKTGNINADTASFDKFVNGGFYGQVYLQKYYPFENQLFTLEFISNGEKYVLGDNLKFNVMKARADFFMRENNSSMNFIFQKDKKLDLTGGIFSKSNRYTLKFQNDFSNNIYQLEAQVKDLNYLTTDPPSQIPTGGYLVDIYENDKLINQTITNIGINKSAVAIRSIIKKWENNFEGLTPYTLKKEQIIAGDSLLILPVNYQIICCANSYVEILRNIEAPKLRLSTNSRVIDVTPITKSFGWAFAGGSLVYFQYTIPTSTASGFYEAQLVYPDGRESLKYWNKIEIK